MSEIDKTLKLVYEIIDAWDRLDKDALFKALEQWGVWGCLGSSDDNLGPDNTKEKLLEGMERIGWPCRLVELPDEYEKLASAHLSLKDRVRGLVGLLELNLAVEEGADPMAAIETEVHRLFDIRKLWSQACDIARTNCPVGVGQSHFQDGIPKLRKERDDLRVALVALQDARDVLVTKITVLTRERDELQCEVDELTTVMRGNVERCLKVLPNRERGE